MTEHLSFPGHGGPKSATVARPPGGHGPGAVVVVPSQTNRAGLCQALASHGLVAASLEPSGDSPAERHRSVQDVDDLAALAGFLFGQAGARPVALLAFGGAVGPALDVVRALHDVVGALVAVSTDGLDPALLTAGVPVQAHVPEATPEPGPASGEPLELVRHRCVPRPEDLVGNDPDATLQVVADFVRRHAG